MSTLDHPERQVLPHLVAGERLDQPAFHERYEAMPRGTWAELVGGRVYIPSPLFDEHGGFTENVSFWLGFYRHRTPGLRASAGASTILGDGTEVQPDHQLRILPELGGKARVVGGYVCGSPELVVEVSRSSREYDLGDKKDDYRRGRVPEYIVVDIGPDHVYWFVLRNEQYDELPAGPDGLYRSEVFPGLWLDPRALLAEDLQGLTAALERGLATPEHAIFVDRLNAPPRA